VTPRARPRPPCGGALLILVVAAALLTGLPVPLRAQALQGRVTQVTLDNGMRFLLMRRATAPVFSAILRFKVGSVDDRSGATGLAHMFEHMAFKGTSVIGTRDPKKEAGILDALDAVARDLHRELDRGDAADPARLEELRGRMADLQKQEQALVVKDEFSEVLVNNGAAGLNASTGQDFTSYVVSLPANRLELWCLMESARLRDPVLREFYSERDVVMEERRMRIDNQPDGKTYEQLVLSAFQAHPYRVSTVGWMSDLASLTRPEAEEFRRTYYVPNNAVGALVGDLDVAQATRLLRRYFGGLPAAPPPPEPVTVEPPQQGERRVTVDFDAEPEVMIAYHKPSLPSPDDEVFEVIDALLTSGRTSRLFRRLVLQTQIASNVYGFEAPGERYPNLYVLAVEPRAPHTTAEAEAEVYKELDRLRREPVPDHELLKIRHQVEANFLYGLRSNQGLASQLSYFESLTGDWKTLLGYYDAVRKVGAAQVQDVARRIFVPANRTVAVLVRHAAATAPAAGPPGAATPDAAPGGAGSGR
jgi:predicted Zn-dependent peptidase